MNIKKFRQYHNEKQIEIEKQRHIELINKYAKTVDKKRLLYNIDNQFNKLKYYLMN